MNHLNEEQLVLYHYREGDTATHSEAESHLAECPDCQAQYAALEHTLAAVACAAVPERPADYELRLWQRLEPRLDEARGFDWRSLFTAPRLALAGAVAVLLIAAFFAGRYAQTTGTNTAGGDSTVEEPAPEQVRERILVVAVGEHLERSQMMLVELINAPSTKDVDLGSKQARAENLIGANRLYRQTASQAGETGVATVLEELERVLLEIAHSPSDMTNTELESLRKRIEARGILFKVRVIGSQMQQRQQTPVAATEPRNIS